LEKTKGRGRALPHKGAGRARQSQRILAEGKIVKRSAKIFCICLCLSAAAVIGLPKTGIIPALAQTAEPSGGEVPKETCLNCHGPFDKLAGAAPGYVAPSGEKVNPHVYVPHTSKEAKAVPECTNCHEPHAVPPKPADITAQPKPEVQWCYTACHHKNNFEPCKDCHK
jgi:hypothetical protein